ncbi:MULTISPECIES: hypothetical protein [Pseudomonas]|uniref:hypothetical protein n=1 Tax=Pseudomonas TaxID=286 RepID=UPI0022497FDC|nr:hypothetical protein [Pseudomonas sp. DCB_BG]MCX2706038.1 hypothetical protein [Pseudomonas sp. DCB_BG]
MSDWFVMATARNWVAAVVHQGRRVMDLQAEDLKLDTDPEVFFAKARVKQMNPDFTHIEDHLFVATVHKSVEWIVEAHKRNLLEPELTAPFLVAADKARTVRNIREHYVEYLNGGGKQKKENVVVINLDDGESTASIDASSVFISPEGRLIGGRLNVQALMHQAEALHPQLFAQQEAIAKRDAQLR